MPSEINSRTGQLSAGIWAQIIDQIPPGQLLPLMFVNRMLRSLVISKLYHKAHFSARNHEGLKFAEAILNEYICSDVVSGIHIAEISFSTRKEADDLVRTISEIGSKLTGLKIIIIMCRYFDDAVWAVNNLSKRYTNVLLEIECEASENPGVYPELIPEAKANIARLAVNSINSRILLELPRLQCLSAVALIHDPHLSEAEFPMIDELSVSYVDWASLNFPTARLLELDLSPNYIYVQRRDEFYYDRVHSFHTQVKISSSLLEQLKLVGLKSTEKTLSDGLDSGSSIISVNIDAHELRRLFICNISPSVTEVMLASTRAPSLEFLSLFPVTISSLRGLLASGLPLQLLLAVVNDSSFTMKNESEIALLTRWIEDAAAIYPTDLRDFSNSLDREIYFGDGMWCNINQTSFKKYIGDVQP